MTSSAFRQGTAADFLGHPTAHFESDRVWFDVLATGGPRIVRFGAIGGPNLFSELPGVAWDMPDGRYESLGGHRLWYAPETLGPSVPDGSGLALQTGAGGVSLTGRREPSGLRRAMEILPDGGDDDVDLVVHHEIANEGEETLEIALWPITAFRSGGIALAPQPRRRPEHNVVPNRPVVLWPYSRWEDDRLSVVDGVVAVAATAGRVPFKVGCLSHDGVLAYLVDGWLFTKRFDPALADRHADFGCNAELFTNERNVEVESLGSLAPLAPGERRRHTEQWRLRRLEAAAPSIHDADALRAFVEGLELA